MNPFLEACGATGPLRLSVECQGTPRAEIVAFDQPYLLIGRDPRADLHFPHNDVSERHVYLQIVAGHLCYMDLGSRSGTYLEGRCLRSGWLPMQKTLRIGPYRIRLLGGIAAEPAPAASAPGRPPGFAPPPLKDASAGRLSLELSHRGIRSSLCQLHGDLTLVGSSTDCDVRILDPSVSNYHCSVLQTPRGVWVVDLLGPGGVTLNGTAVRSAHVLDGDELRVGQSLIRLRSGSRPEIAATTGELPSIEEDIEADESEELEAAHIRDAAQGVATAASSDLVKAPALEPVSRELMAEMLKTELVETFLTPLVDQFRVMQQQMFDDMQRQMFDELNQAGIHLLQQFNTEHQEQARVLKRELDKLQRLNQELETLKAELAAKTPETSNGHSSPPTSPRLGTVITSPLPVSRIAGLNGNGTSYTPPRSPNGNGTAHTNGNGHTNGASPANGASHKNGSGHSNGTAHANGSLHTNGSAPTNGAAYTNGTSHANGTANGNGKVKPTPAPPASDERPAINLDLGSVKPKASKANGSHTPKPEKTSPEAPTSKECPPRSTPRPDEDVHAWLCQRITMIQGEQQSRWQKILKMFPGRPTG